MKRALSALCGLALAGSFVWVAAVVACNQVLGIHEAALDTEASAVDAGSFALCADYCARVGQNCTGTNQEYHPAGDCQTLCPYFAAGLDGDTTGNTTSCRIWHANFAAESHMPDVHCRHAGPLGGGACSPDAATVHESLCMVFCQLDLGLCGHALAGTKCGMLQDTITYEDLPNCLRACANYPYIDDGGELYIDDAGTAYDKGNTLNCRMYHLENAAVSLSTGDTNVASCHCSHATELGGGVCVDTDN
jgi:hypothetical protein